MQFVKADIFSSGYIRFVNENGSVFNQPSWLCMYGDAAEVIAVYEKEEIVAVFNMYYFRKAIFRFCIPPPFSPDCALAIKDSAMRGKIVEAVANYIQNKQRRGGFSLFRFAFSYGFSDLLVQGLEDGYRRNHTYVLDLTSAENVQSLYEPKRRQQIRRAQKDGLQAVQITDLTILYELIKQTFERQKKNIDLGFIKKILFEYGRTGNSFAFVSFKQGKPLTGYFCVYFNNYAYYLLGGYDDSDKHIGAGPLAMNACIEYAKSIGITTFDFEGSMVPSIEKYFKEFGGQKKEYLYFEKTSFTGSLILKAKKLIHP